jgi:hypothetical protein
VQRIPVRAFMSRSFRRSIARCDRLDQRRREAG